MHIVRLYLSDDHNYVGHYGKPAGKTPVREVSSVECVAGEGLRGDRYFGFRQDYKGQITFFAWEVHRRLCEKFDLDPVERSPSVYRRNVLTTGVDLNGLIGEEFELQGVRFRGTEECKPCFWMDQAFGPGAEEALKGNGGLRARILSDGELRIAAPSDPALVALPDIQPPAP